MRPHPGPTRVALAAGGPSPDKPGCDILLGYRKSAAGRAESLHSRFPLTAKAIGQGISYYIPPSQGVRKTTNLAKMSSGLIYLVGRLTYIAHRLRNEAAALLFVAEHIMIPVPRDVDLWEQNG